MPIRKEFRKNYQTAKNIDPIYMTQEEFEQLKYQAKAKEKELKEAAKEVGEAADQSSETWHDNAPFDIATENTILINKQYLSIIEKFQRAVIVTTKTQRDMVVFGTKVEVEINLTMKKVFTVSGKSDPNEGKISISSPMAEAIIGKKEGEEGSFTVGTKTTRVKILKIFDCQGD